MGLIASKSLESLIDDSCSEFQWEFKHEVFGANSVRVS